MAGVGAWLGSFFCLLTAATTVRMATLPPRMSTPTPAVVAAEGQTSVVLQCVLDVGDDPVSYRWLKDQELVTGALGYGYRTHRKVLLALHTIEPQHTGVYTCEASNEVGVDTASITVTVDSSEAQQQSSTEAPHTDEILSNIATSLSDVLAEGDCHCDTLFLLHATPDAPPETLAAQANFVYTIGNALISSTTRVSVMTYSDYVDTKLTFSAGVNRCALRDAFKDLSHKQWPTRIQQVLREVFKKFRKPKTACKVLFIPIFGSLGTEGADVINAQHLKKLGVKIFVLEVTDAPLPNVEEMASKRGDGQPYHWRIPLSLWPTIVINMKYMTEELVACPPQEDDLPGQCVSPNAACSSDAECLGIGFGCRDGQCQILECNINQGAPGCCSEAGHYWCGDVTNQCTGPGTICDGRVQCMNGADESRCWSSPCPADKVARCQTSTLCLGLTDLCNGEPECPGGEDEDPRFCRSFPCPLDRPFRCLSGKCIAKESVCDGVFKDCIGGEDEDLDYCNRVHVCPPTRPFKCDYGICIPDRMVCDSNYNCLDAADELVCGKKSCPADRPFKCLRSGQCISMAQVCNGVLDGCEDGSDERNCSHIPCPVERPFKCSSGECIDRWLACDGNDDCGDGSDEFNCGNATTTTVRPEEPSCARDEFLCQSGACIHESRVCDGRAHCPDSEDERDCHARPCPITRPYRCNDGICIVSAVQCDGFRDCGDGSDEINCTDSETESVYEDEYYNYEDYKDEVNNEILDTVPEEPVLPVPAEAPTTVPPIRHDGEGTDEHETVLEDDADYEDDSMLHNTPIHSDSSGGIEDVGIMLEEPVPETEPEPADVQTAASSEQGYSGSPCTSFCASLILAPIMVLSLCSVWMR